MNSKTCLDLSGLTIYDKKIKDFIANKNSDIENKLSSHSNNKSNPHNVTKAQIGLGNVENKSSKTILNELTSQNISNALGYTPPPENYVIEQIQNAIDTTWNASY